MSQFLLVQTLFLSRFSPNGQMETNRNHVASRVCSTVSEDNRSALKELNEIKHRLRKDRMCLAHPDISVSDLHNFTETINPGPSSILRSILMELETMEVWRGDLDKMERLFAE